MCFYVLQLTWPWVQAMLLEALRRTERPPVIVFCNTAETVDRVTHLLRREQFHAGGLHGEHSQPHRSRVIQLARTSRCDVLVATDLASRGLDLPGVTHVINYDLPTDIAVYVHRCGRTGRAGQTGMATSFLTRGCRIAKELRQLLALSRQVRCTHCLWSSLTFCFQEYSI